MSPLLLGALGFVAILFLIAARFPIGLALGLVSLVGTAGIIGWSPAFAVLGALPYQFASAWELSAVPMFLLMGTLAFHSGMTESLYRVARLWLGFLPGGLAVATCFACAGFAAASGSSLATTIAMGKIAIPEMRRVNYDVGLATGVCASAGTLGSLIPPSVLMILYGVFAQQSIATLFVAGVLPGLLTAVAFSAMIVVRCHLVRGLAPRAVDPVPLRTRLAALVEIWPLPVLVLGVIGGIYVGLVTPTEAGAFGAVFAFLIAAAQRRLSRRILYASLREALQATAAIFFIAIGAVFLTKFMALSGLPHALSDAIGDVAINWVFLLLGIAFVYVVLGMFLEPLGLLLLTMPIMLPLVQRYDLDLIWFGILVIKFLEIGLMTPPVGLNVFAVKTVVGGDVSLAVIFRGVLWFLVAEVGVIAMLIAFPAITLILPRLMPQ